MLTNDEVLRWWSICKGHGRGISERGFWIGTCDRWTVDLSDWPVQHEMSVAIAPDLSCPRELLLPTQTPAAVDCERLDNSRPGTCKCQKSFHCTFVRHIYMETLVAPPNGSVISFWQKSVASFYFALWVLHLSECSKLTCETAWQTGCLFTSVHIGYLLSLTWSNI